MTDHRHPASSPEIAPLIDLLAAHGVRCVLTGSVAALAYGVDLQPGDLDITPALDPENLRRLIAVLREVEAQPDNVAGRWDIQPDGERRWIADDLSPADRAAENSAWTPDPSRIETLDHLFRTRHGNFDVVPEVAGTYERLARRAQQLQIQGRAVWVAHIDDLLATLTVPRRTKDVARVRDLRAIQHQRGLQADHQVE